MQTHRPTAKLSLATCLTVLATWLLGAHAAADVADRRPLEHIYESSVLQDRQYRYAKFFTVIFDEAVKPHLQDEERVALSTVSIKVTPVASGMEPLGFYSTINEVRLSAASLKLFNDLILSYVWLSAHGYGVQTIDDYLRMLRSWHRAEPPPEPLMTLGIPDNAWDDKKVGDQATELTRSLYLTILLHELGHVYHKDSAERDSGVEMSRSREVAADRFALDFLGRTGQLGDGFAKVCEWQWDLLPSHADFSSDAEYAQYTAGRTHPLSTQRLVTVADDIDQHWAQYANATSAENHRAFLELAEKLRKMAALQDNLDFQRDMARRGKMLEPGDLSPRPLGELLGRPLGVRLKDGPFQGKLFGKVVKKNEASLDVEMFIENLDGRVDGTLAMGSELVRIRGELEADRLPFHWRSADAEGEGMLWRRRNHYEGTTNSWPATEGSVWTLNASDTQNR